MPDTKSELKEAISNIVDTLTCSDGGKRFLDFKMLISEMERQASNGDKPAQEVVELVLRFSRLLNMATKICDAAKE